MTRAEAALFIEHRFIPVDGTRRVIADGHVERQGAEALAAGEALLDDLARAIHGHRCSSACDEGPDTLDRTSAEAALRWMNGRRQREGERP